MTATVVSDHTAMVPVQWSGTVTPGRDVLARAVTAVGGSYRLDSDVDVGAVSGSGDSQGHARAGTRQQRQDLPLADGFT